MKIDSIKSKQREFDIFSANISVNDLVRITAVDCADPTNKQKGYQRRGKAKRFDQIAKYLTGKNAFMPTPIVLSYRGNLIKNKIKGGIIELEIPDDEKLWVIDGQHRLGGLKLLSGLDQSEGIQSTSKKYKLYNDDFRSFEMPVVIIECSSRSVEAAIFAIINGKAEKVDIFLATLAANQGGGEKPTGEDAWKSRAANAVQHLNNSKTSVLLGKIKHPTMSKGHFVCSAKGFMNQLEPFMNDGMIAALWNNGYQEEIYKMLENYWLAWSKIIPFCFQDPKNYALFKNSGLRALSASLIMMIRKIGTDFPNEKQFISIISKLNKFTTELYWHKNGPDGINRCVGLGPINREIKKIEAKIVSISNNGSTGKLSKR